MNTTFTFVNYIEGSNGDDTILGSNVDKFEGFAGFGGNDYIDGRGGFNEANYREGKFHVETPGTGITANLRAEGTLVSGQTEAVITAGGFV